MGDEEDPGSTTAVNDLTLKHGLVLNETHKFSSKVLSLLYNSTEESFVVLLRGAIIQYHLGQKIKSLDNERGFLDLIHVSEYDKYVGVGDHTLYLLQKDLTTVLQESVSESSILCCLYNIFDGSFITAGIGYINVWRFHRGGKSLLSDHVIRNGLDEDERVSLLHAEEVPGNAQRLFAVIGCGIKVFLLASSQLINEGNCLHARPISSVLFFRPLTYLITGARDGSIKVWNQSWILQYSFISHQSPVTTLNPYPAGPCIISGSLDGTLRLWNLYYWDKVQEVDHALPVHGLHSEPGHQTIISYSSRQVKTWNASELYKRCTVVGSDAVKLSSSFHPLAALRLTGTFTDSTVRVISAKGGSIITTMLLPHQLTVVSAVHMPYHEWVFLLTSDGNLSKYDTNTLPSQKISKWAPTEDNGSYSSLALYQLVMDQEEIEDLITHDKWLSVMIDAHRMKRGIGLEHPLQREREGVQLIIAGTETGAVCVLNKTSGETQCFVQSHSTRITHILPHPKRDQILSVSTDDCIRIWRVYAYTRECLVQMMSFNVVGVPTHLSVLFDRICVSVNDSDRASYTNTMYSLIDRITFSSNPFHNHTERITGLDVCAFLHIFATSSIDCSIRIWSQDNNLLRILQLDAPPTALAFSNPFGGLMVSVRHHLHTITHTTHLTKEYIRQLVSLGIREEDLKAEEPRALTRPLEEYDIQDQLRLQPVDDEIEVKSYRGALSEEELNLLDRIKEAKRLGMEKLVEHDKELRDIRDGSLTARKNQQEAKSLPKALKNKAWREVFSMIRPLHPLDIAIPPFDDFDPDTYGIPVEIPEPYEPYHCEQKAVFFPPLSKFLPPYPIAPDGFLPNSIILQKLRKSDEDKLLAKQWRPPVLTDRQRKLMDEKKVEEEIESSSGDSELMERLRTAMMAKEKTPTPTPPPTPPPDPEPPREIKTQMKVEKIIAPKAKRPKTPPPKPRSPTPPPPPRSPTPPPPPPPTPLPEYIAQFIGQKWFDSLYPKANSKTFPRPWSVTRFMYALVSWIPKPSKDCLTKAEICAALLKLIKEYTPNNIEEVCSVVMNLLKGPPFISSQHLSERHLVKRGLELLMHISNLDNQMMALLMSHYSESNPEIKDLILEYFQSKGVMDPHKYFARELDTSFVSPSSSLSDLVVKSLAWIESWSIDYLKSKGVKLPRQATAGQKKPASSSLRSTKSQPALKLPYCDPIEVINHFVRTEHEKELAKRKPPTPPPPPLELEEDTLHNVVVPLPPLEHSRGCLVRLGETHCSKCHPERETSLAHISHIIKAQQRHVGQSLRAINLSMRTQNVNPFLTPEERREIELFEQSRNRLISNTKLFLLEQSYPQ